MSHQFILNPYHQPFMVSMHLPPSNVKNYSTGYKLETGQQKKKQKGASELDFLHLSASFWLKIQNTHCYRNLATFWASG